MMKFLNKLLGDEEIATLLGSEKDIEAMVRFELALLRAQNANGLVSKSSFEAISNHLTLFRLDDHSLIDATKRDGAVVPDLIRQMRAQLPEELRRFLHFGVSSQDVIDTAFAVKMIPIFRILEDRLASVLSDLDNLVGQFGSNQLQGSHKRQNSAAAIVIDRLLAWRGPLERAFEKLYIEEQATLIVAMDGTTNTSEKLAAQYDNIRFMIGEELGLSVPEYLPHSQRDRIVNLAHWLGLITGALGKIGQDIDSMILQDDTVLTFEGGNAAKSENHLSASVLTEVLATLAGFNAMNVAGLHQSYTQSSDRSGAAWRMEWMILPKMIEATGAALSHTSALLQSIDCFGIPSGSK